MMLNILQPSRVNPLLSAYNQIWGLYKFDEKPLTPPGCKVVVHKASDKRGTYASHGVIGYYCAPLSMYYQNYECYIPETGGIRNSARVEFFPKHVQMPKTSSEDRLAAVLEDLKEALKTPHPSTPFTQQGTTTNNAICKLHEIF